MGKKVEKFGAKKVLEYIEVEMPPANGKRGARVPRIVSQETLTINQVINRALERGYAIGRPNFFKAQFESLMATVMDCLEEGVSVNLGGYFRIQPHLQGTLDASGELTRKNRLSVRVTPLSKMKIELSSFSWRRKGCRVKSLA